MAKVDGASKQAPVQQTNNNDAAKTAAKTAVNTPTTNNQTIGRDSKLGEQNTQANQVKTQLNAKVNAVTAPPDLATQATVTRTGNQVVIDAGTGDDNVGVRQDAKTGDVTVSVNGAERTFTGADRDNLVIKAGEGNDTITVGKGVTVSIKMEGGNGDDRISVDNSVKANQTIEGGAGNDNITGGGGRDYINGSTGNDNINGGAGDDVVYGGDGDDSINGAGGDDYIDGGTGSDNLRGSMGKDIVSGGLGNDNIDGGSGDDTLYAGGGTDNLTGGTGRNSIYAQTGTDTVQASNAKNNINNVVVNVELKGNPGSVSVKVEGSPEFIERVQADLETMRSSPNGRAMLESFDKSYNETRSSLAGMPLIGGMFNDGTTLTIKETSGGNSEQTLGTKGSGRNDAQVNYNTQRVSLGSTPWQNRPPIVGFYHEMAHANDSVNDTFAKGKYAGVDQTNQGVNNLERVAVGLPIDHDNNPMTPEIKDPKHPSDLTENTFRDELNLPLRPRY